jgi:hypothetical protein
MHAYVHNCLKDVDVVTAKERARYANVQKLMQNLIRGNMNIRVENTIID